MALGGVRLLPSTKGSGDQDYRGKVEGRGLFEPCWGYKTVKKEKQFFFYQKKKFDQQHIFARFFFLPNNFLFSFVSVQLSAHAEISVSPVCGIFTDSFVPVIADLLILSDSLT